MFKTDQSHYCFQPIKDRVCKQHNTQNKRDIRRTPVYHYPFLFPLQGHTNLQRHFTRSIPNPTVTKPIPSTLEKSTIRTPTIPISTIFTPARYRRRSTVHFPPFVLRLLYFSKCQASLTLYYKTISCSLSDAKDKPRKHITAAFTHSLNVHLGQQTDYPTERIGLPSVSKSRNLSDIPAKHCQTTHSLQSLWIPCTDLAVQHLQHPLRLLTGRTDKCVCAMCCIREPVENILDYPLLFPYQLQTLTLWSRSTFKISSSFKSKVN